MSLPRPTWPWAPLHHLSRAVHPSVRLCPPKFTTPACVRDLHPQRSCFSTSPTTLNMYPPIEPYEVGKLKVSDLHTLQYVDRSQLELLPYVALLAMSFAETRRAHLVYPLVDSAVKSMLIHCSHLTVIFLHGTLNRIVYHATMALRCLNFQVDRGEVSMPKTDLSLTHRNIRYIMLTLFPLADVELLIWQIVMLDQRGSGKSTP